MQKIKNNERIEIWGDGSVVRDFIYVFDLARSCVLAGESEYCGILNVGSGVGNSVRDVLDISMEVSDCTMKPMYKTGRAYDVPSVVLDVSKVRDVLGWQPRIGLKEGVTKTWIWLNSL